MRRVLYSWGTISWSERNNYDLILSYTRLRCSQVRNSAASRASTWRPEREEIRRARIALRWTLRSRRAWLRPTRCGANVTLNRTASSWKAPTDTSHSWSRSSSSHASTVTTTRGRNTVTAARVGRRARVGLYRMYRHGDAYKNMTLSIVKENQLGQIKINAYQFYARPRSQKYCPKINNWWKWNWWREIC